MHRRIAFAASILCLASGGSATAQSDGDFLRSIERRLQLIDAEYRHRVAPDQPISERLLFDYGGSLRLAFVASDDTAGRTRILRQSDATFFLRAELDGAHRFYGRLRLLYNDFNSGDSFDGRGDELERPLSDRYWYEFDLRGLELAEHGRRLDWNLNVRAGRQYVHWGSGLALSNELYAARVGLELPEIALVGLVGQTPGTGTIDFDATRPGYDTSTRRDYFGVSAESTSFAHHRPYVSALVQRDDGTGAVTVFDTPIGDVRSRFGYDSEYYAIGSRGTLSSRWLYRAELVHQRGHGLSSPVDPATGFVARQTTEDIEAWAGMIAVSYLAHDVAHTMFEIEVAAGSGDSDRAHPSNTFGGNRSGTSDQAFNGLGYINTGLAVAPEISNLLMLRASVHRTVFDRRRDIGRLDLSVDGFLLAKIDDDAPLSVPSDDETFLGAELDLSVDWRITSDLEATLRYGIFFPGDAAVDNDVRHFLYMGLTHAF